LIDIDLIPLTGTTDEKHMKEDLQVLQWPSFDNDLIAQVKKNLFMIKEKIFFLFCLVKLYITIYFLYI
jgi:hypothetical protein